MLVVVFVLRTKKDKEELEQKDHKSGELEKKQEQEKLVKKNLKDQPTPISLRKVNDITFYISNQIAFWLFLPLISAMAAEFMI